MTWARRLGVVALALIASGLDTGEGRRPPRRLARELLAQPASPEASEGTETSTVLPLPTETYTLRQGRALFDHYCATCHGEEGRGDGFNAYNLDPKPRDLGDPAFQTERSGEDLAALIRIGGGAAGLSNAMPPWGRVINARQIGQLVEYLRTLRAEEEAE